MDKQFFGAGHWQTVIYRPNLGCSLPASALSNRIVFIPDSSGQMAHLSQHKIGSVTPLYSLLGTAFYFVLEETMVYPPIFLAFFLTVQVVCIVLIIFIIIIYRSSAGVAALDGFLFCIGGNDGTMCLQTGEKFNPRRNVWEPIATMHSRRYSIVCSVSFFLLFSFFLLHGGKFLMKQSDAESFCQTSF